MNKEALHYGVDTLSGCVKFPCLLHHLPKREEGREYKFFSVCKVLYLLAFEMSQNSLIPGKH